MTYKNLGRAFFLLAGFGFAACGGSTTINFVGDPDSTGGEGGEGTGGNDGDGGGNLGGMGGDGSGGTGTGGGSGGGIIVLGYCGDGAISAADDEVCDDGNERSGDGCSAACIVEPPFACFGEPSVCNTCGNGTHDDGEACDDGNVADGDGCSAQCTVEGTCADPVLVEFEEDGFGTASAVMRGDTSAGGGTTAARACNGLLLGAGNDRTYFVELTQQSDLTVTVDSDFDAIVRIYGSYQGSICEPDMEAFCIDDVGAGDVEKFHYRRMPGEGAIVITVDGAEEGEEGDFTLTVTQGCDADHVKLHRLTPFSSGGNTETVSLKNISDYCTVNLDTVGFAVTDDIAPGPLAVDLPELGLAPGQVFRGSFDVIDDVNPNSFDFAETPLAFDSIAAGAYVCNGPCDLDTGTNVTDGVLTGSAPNLQIPGTTFLPGQQDVSNSPYESHVRVAYDGVAPDFVATDWSPAFLVDPDDYEVDWFGYYNDAGYPFTLGSMQIESDAVEGNFLSFPAPEGSFSYSAYVATVPTVVQTATYASYKVRTSGDPSYGCYTGIGTDNGSLGTSTGFSGTVAMSYAFQYYIDPAIGWYDINAAQIPTDTTQWHTVEFVNINWTNHTYDYYFDGNLMQAAASMYDTALSSLGVFALTPYYPVACQYSDIIVRNGPPGRIWESPPVLVAPD